MEVEHYTLSAIADWLKTDRALDVTIGTVRQAIWRQKGKEDELRPDDLAPPIEPADPEDVLQSLRYQLARDAHVARVRMIKDPSDGNAGKLYLGFQRLRVSLLCALRDKGRGAPGPQPQLPSKPPQPVATFVLRPRDEVKPS